jgi:aspartate/methionine/tyrosine aminotransferase
MSSLSSRGTAAITTGVLRTNMEKYFDAVQNIFHPTDNPNGKFPLSVAENRLSWDALREKIQTVTAENDIPAWVAGYTSWQGNLGFRTAVADFLSKCLTLCTMEADKLAFAAGGTSVVETSALVLGDNGDVVAFPAPCYPAYKQDIQNVPNLERFDIVTHHDITSLKNGSLLTISHLEETKATIEAQDKQFKILVLTNPDNPTGILYSYEKLLEIANWCEVNKIHLIVNEIYGLSLIDTEREEIKADYAEKIVFRSFAQIMNEKHSDYLHLWYAFSKDFGISGFRVGLVYSHNSLFIKAFESLNYSHLVSNYTQWILQKVLEDTEWVKSYTAINQKRLTESYLVVVQTLKKLQLNYVPSRGSLFVWVDLSPFLEASTGEAENEFWLKLYAATGILLTPGEGFGHTKKGLFRIVYPFVPIDHLKIAMERFEKFILAL